LTWGGVATLRDQRLTLVAGGVGSPDDTRAEPLIDVARPVPDEAWRQAEKWRPITAAPPGFEGSC